MAYSNKKHIQQLVYLLKAHGVTEVVLCPGSRNMPIVESLCNGDFNVHRALDERSAGFMAVGMAQSSARVAVCVTSGSAVANLLPSLIEAKLQGLGMVVVTADRPKEMIGQMMGQTMDQTGALASAVKYSVNVEDDESDDGMWYANREINAALISAYFGMNGPVQINMQIKEPFFECKEDYLGKFRKIEYIDDLKALWNTCKRPLVVVGQGSGMDLKVAKNIPVYVEVLGNLDRAKYNVISDEDIENYNPDLVVYIGGHIVSKIARISITKMKPKSVVRIGESLEFADTFKSLTHVAVSSSWVECLNKEVDFVPVSALYKDGVYPSVYADFLKNIKPNSTVFVANSTSVRAIDYAYSHLRETRDKGLRFMCNRGVNGIEGSLSAAVGYASLYPNETTYIVIGDLSFFYDVSSLWSVGNNLRILLVNDGRGSIFSRLKGLEQTDTVQKFVSESHEFCAEGIASTYKLEYASKNGCADELTWKWYNDTKKDKSKLLEVFL
ncbi:MAG: hypothetical protein MJZ19_00835 [Paludibacteraceae bacterium]|nr:hypothetical protein [Paludibacteraceae bacterium]